MKLGMLNQLAAMFELVMWAAQWKAYFSKMIISILEDWSVWKGEEWV